MTGALFSRFRVAAKVAPFAHALRNRQIANVAANFASSGASFIFPLVFNVTYFRVLGSESYGLIGFYASLVILSGFLDMGFSQTTIREFARRATDPAQAGGLRRILFTLQCLYVLLGLVFGMGVLASSHWIATSWLHGSKLGPREVSTSVSIMAGMLALSFSVLVSAATLRGLQRQVLSSSLTTGMSLARGCCVLACLYLFGATPITFFSTQLAVSIIEVTVWAAVCWRLVPPSTAPLRFDVGFLRSVWRFSSVNGLAVLLGQLMMMSDKIMLSNLLSLESFGLYNLAVTVASAQQRLISPISTAYFPHFVELAESNDQGRLSHAYHLTTQVASAILLSAGILLAIYAHSIVLLLSANPTAAAKLAPVASLLVVAYMMNAIMWLPHSLQLAYGVASIGLRMNIVQGAAYLPLLLFLTPRFGMYVPATLWLLVNLFQFPIFIALTHRVGLQGEGWQWVKRSVLLPGIGAGSVIALGTLIAPVQVSWTTTLPWIAANGIVALTVALGCSSKVQEIVVSWLRLHRRTISS